MTSDYVRRLNQRNLPRALWKMADYWKSQPRKFCEICKCWFGDNKASIDFHENGKRHKENVVKSLKEARERSVNKQQSEEKLDKDLASIEKAALKAFEKDVASDLTLTVRDSSYQLALLRQKKKEWEEEEKEKQAAKDRREAAMISSAIARAHAALPQVGERKSAPVKEERKPPPPPNPWSALTSPEGYTYYYNAITGVSQWECPPDFSTPHCASTTRGTSSSPRDGSAGTKRGSAEAENSTQSKRQSTRRTNPYGEWTTVAVRESSSAKEDEVVGSNASSKEREKTGSDDEDEDSDGERLPHRRNMFQEKTMPVSSTEASSLLANASFTGFGFRKKAKANMRQRNTEL